MALSNLLQIVVAGATVNDAGLPVDYLSPGRPRAEFIAENPQDSEIATKGIDLENNFS